MFAHRQECGDTHTRIARPREAIVPVAHSSDLLGKGGRRCCNWSSGGAVREKAQVDQAADEHVAMRWPTTYAFTPLPPPTIRALKQICGDAMRHGAAPRAEDGADALARGQFPLPRA